MVRPTFLMRGALALAAMASIAVPSLAAEPAPGTWDFRVLLDDKPIGEHHFRVTTSGDRRDVVSDADFEVSILGFAAYRYHHVAHETWRENCLTSLVSNTDDDGKPLHVQLGGRAAVPASAAASAASSPLPEGCVMSYAYWTSAIRTQTRLLNAQTGQLDAVRISALPATTIDVHGKPVAATGFRIAGPTNPVDVWYGDDGAWVGLDSVVKGGRKLSYRLP